ncbi:hypothetical protein DENSPDRAFT_561274 [Dentipellis sp. KUC8613]|nr:hypothetical protein DENSPDRAFT_561274 [Dentipellis sp. KUC8613]
MDWGSFSSSPPFAMSDPIYDDALDKIPTIIAEMTLYGIHLSMSTATAIMLQHRSTGGGLAHRWLFMMLALMFIVATVYIAISIVEVYQGATSFGGDIPTQCTAARQFLLVIQVALGDTITIWRCYKVSSKSIIVVALPVLTAVTSFALGLFFAGTEAQALNQLGIMSLRSGIWAAITMACTVYCASAISYKLYSSTRLSKSGNLFTTMLFIIETSLIYTLGIIAYVVASVTRTIYAPNGVIETQDLFMGMVVQLPPIVLCLLLIQSRFYTSGNQAVRYLNKERARPWAALRRFFRTRREASVEGQMIPVKIAPAAARNSMHTMSAESHQWNADDAPSANESESDTVGKQGKEISGILDIV